MGSANMEKFNKKEFGDYQTPLTFTETICEYLKNNLEITPEIIIEPTCGIGNFLKSASEFFPGKELYGIDIDAAKLKGKHLGRPKTVIPDEWDYYYNLYQKRQITASEMMHKLSIPKSTFYKLLKSYNNNYGGRQ